MIALTGITWNHSRGLVPLVAASQRFHELHPDVDVRWEKRSLQSFGDAPLSTLAANFDLLVIDHPFVGSMAAERTAIPLDEWLPASVLDDCGRRSVGQSHASYAFDGHQWALAIDAAAPVSAWRPDLIDSPPQSWDELIDLARSGRVVLPAIPVDSLMHFYVLCIGNGEEPFLRPGQLIGRATGIAALEQLRELVSACEPACLSRNPIQTYQALASRDDLAYCPFAFGYSNYSRDGYAPRRLRFGGLPGTLRSTLGGTGLAVSARSQNKQSAAGFVGFVASETCQRGIYVQNAGQPAHRAAWNDADANRIAHGYFHDTLQTLDDAFMRPRFNGYVPFQEEAGQIIHAFLQTKSEPRETFARLIDCYRDSYEAA